MKNYDQLLPQPAITHASLWATVTQASPLRIQLDGDPGPLPFTPDTLVAGLQVDDRVYVDLFTNNDPLFRGRRVVVLGRSSGGMPPGVYVPFAGATAPTGWLLCDGSAISRTTYAALFATIGTTYGVGDGSTTFNIPDLRGRVPVGRDSGQAEFDTLGESGGAKTHTLTASEIQHYHYGAGGNTNTDSGNIVTLTGNPHGGATRVVLRNFNHQNTGFSNFNDNITEVPTEGATINSPSAHNNLQPYRVANYIIKT